MQPNAVLRIVGLFIGGDLLDVHWGRKLVDVKVLGINDADAPERHEPKSAIRGFCDNRVIAARRLMAAHSLGTVENRRLDRLRWMGDPGVQLRPANTPEATGQIQPDRMKVILSHPVNRIAGQSVLVRELQNAAVFDPAQPALSCNPEAPGPIDVETADHALAQALGA